MVSPSFWRARKVFLTGHTGFKGGWLCVLLKRLGAEVHGYALEPDPGGAYLSNGGDGMISKSTIADIRDPERLAEALTASEAEVVFHLAAQPLVRRSYEIPAETYAVNVMGSVHLLDAVRQTPSVRSLVMVTSDKCYENREWVWGYREDEPMGGFDPYSNSKGCAELVTSAYRQSFFSGGSATAVASARAGNVIGGGDLALDRLVPDLAKAFAAGEITEIRHPEAIRPWQHVLEPLWGYILLAQRLYANEARLFASAWNFGPASSSERTVGEVADAAARRWGDGAQWRHIRQAQLHEARFLKLDSSKARSMLGWSPRWDFQTTIDHTIDWYRAAARGDDVAALTLNQVELYLSSKPFF
jgi:CDP-glucose 4,6-dehydratase